MSTRDHIISELDSLIERGERLSKSFRPKDTLLSESNIPEYELRAFVTSSLAAIERISDRKSQYYEQAPKPGPTESLALEGHRPKIIPGLIGVLLSLREAVENGLLHSLESELRAAIHDDMLEQAADLLDSNYHVAAMVLIGGVLENHLQLLCKNRNLSWVGTGGIGTYNDLLKDSLYKRTIWRRIQVVGDERNYAAHGDVGNVDPADVKDSLNFTRRIIVDFPE